MCEGRIVSNLYCQPIVIASQVCSRLRAHYMCANIHVRGNPTCPIRCTIRPNPKWTDVACYITWYQFTWHATVNETQNSLVQLQPTPSVDSNMHHIGVDDESFTTSYTEDTERISRLHQFLICLELVHPPLLRITLCSPPVLQSPVHMNVRCPSQHDELRWQCALVDGWQRPKDGWDK